MAPETPISKPNNVYIAPSKRGQAVNSTSGNANNPSYMSTYNGKHIN